MISINAVSQDKLPQVKDWILNHHYIRRWPKAVQAVLLVTDDSNKPIGCLVYGIGTRGQSTSEIFQNDDGSPVLQNNQMWELQRAFTTDEAKKEIPNLGSMVISKGNEWIRQNAKTKDGKPVKAIISYADSEAGHKGSVYQSTNALYLGEQKPLPYFIVTNPKNGKYERLSQITSKAKQLLKDKGYSIERKIPQSGKHKFVYPLGKDQRERDQLAAKIAKPLYSYPDGVSKPHQIQNLAKERVKKSQPIPQANQMTKREAIKRLLNSTVKNPETGHNILVASALRYDKNHPSHKQAMGMLNAYAKKYDIKLKQR